MGEATHYGPVISFPPFADPDTDQSVIVQLDPATFGTLSAESVSEQPPASYDKISLFPITVDRLWIPGDEPPPDETSRILEEENLTVENVSSMIKPGAFSLWQRDCMLAKDTIDALQSVSFAIAHRYSATTDRDPQLEEYSAELVDSAVACLSLVRPTRKSRAGRIVGSVNADGILDPQSFNAHEPAEVPEVQKLFSIRNRDVVSLRTILPEFLRLYPKDSEGRIKDEYEPLRMAVQLYEQAYAIHYWKARHILWWAAIESLYGNAEHAAMARIFAFFGKKVSSTGIAARFTSPGIFRLAIHIRHVPITRWGKWCLSCMPCATRLLTDRKYPIRTLAQSRTHSERWSVWMLWPRQPPS